LDTDILIGLLKGDRTAINTLRKLENEPVKTTTITAYELLKGALISTKPEENTLAVRRLLSTLQLLTLNEGSCGKASEVYKVLKEAGKMISEFDILIAGIVLYNDEALLSRDEHFRLVRNLGLEQW